MGLGLRALVPHCPGREDAWGGFLASATGAALGFGLLWAVGWIGSLLFRKDAMGFGDVKLLGAIGAFLGAPAILFVVFVSSLLGSVVGITCILLKKNEMGGRIPFGPYLSAAALAWILGGETLFQAYFRWLLGSGGA